MAAIETGNASTGRSPEVPEADAGEQLQEHKISEAAARPRIDIGVPEADAIEQAQPAPFDEEDEYR